MKKRKASKVVIHHENSRTVTKGCTGFHVNLQQDVQYCRLCMRKLCNGTEEERNLIGKEKKKRCKLSRLSCPSCDEPICADCWDEGYHMHDGVQVNNVSKYIEYWLFMVQT
jgi:hypothetical protein